MILLTFLYDEYIDRPKLTEQKKPIWVYSSSPPQVGSEQLSSWAKRGFAIAFAFALRS